MVRSDLLNQAFSVHLCEYSHRNPARVHVISLAIFKNGVQDLNSMYGHFVTKISNPNTTFIV